MSTWMRYHTEHKQTFRDDTAQIETRYRVVDSWTGREVLRTWDREAAYRTADSRERAERQDTDRVASAIVIHAQTNGLAGRRDCIPLYDARDGAYCGDSLSPSYVPWDESYKISPLGDTAGAPLVDHVADCVTAWRARNPTMTEKSPRVAATTGGPDRTKRSHR